MSEGWLFKVTIPGSETDSRFIERYAAWIADQTAALEAVQALRGNIKDPPLQVERPCSEAELRADGVEKGKAKRYHVGG
jgi:hypothetical protein